MLPTLLGIQAWSPESFLLSPWLSEAEQWQGVPETGFGVTAPSQVPTAKVKVRVEANLF